MGKDFGPELESFIANARREVVGLLARARIQVANPELEVTVQCRDGGFLIEFGGVLAVNMRQRRLPARVRGEKLRDAILSLERCLPIQQPLLTE